MSEQITTKDLSALNELMTFENWVAVKSKYYSEMVQDRKLKAMFDKMANTHLTHHTGLLGFLKGERG